MREMVDHHHVGNDLAEDALLVCLVHARLRWRRRDADVEVVALAPNGVLSVR
jgi:hypothetical protein